MSQNYDVIVIGSGPGGYVAAIRASQLNMKVAVVEAAELGGICLNWGCIPTKALLKSAQVFEYIQHAEEYGIKVSSAKHDFEAMIQRSREVANGMSKGIQFLFRKNKIDLIQGWGKLTKDRKVEVTDKEGKKKVYEAKHIIIATGGRARELPHIKIDNEKVIGYRKAMTLEKQPKKMVIMGSGAIGVEFAYFYHSIGTEVTIVEYLPRIVPNEDEEVSKQLEKIYKKKGMKIYTSSEVIAVDTQGKGCKVTVKTPNGEEVLECDVLLSAVGVVANIENIGLEDAGVKVEKGKIVVDEFYRTNVPGVYAIGDVTPGPALAHVASAEGIICVEKIAGLNPHPLNYGNIPGCTYCQPEIASVGMTEQQAREAGYEIKVGKFPYTASGKASAAGAKDGFVKVIFDAKYGEWLGAHMIGANVTEMIAEVVVARNLETTGHEIIKSVHPHPTMSEAIMEAVAAAYGEVIHL
ncbi:dihydrolipoamide dehydrogenase [Thermonema lapsum]|uniref:Dihydrolipoyl dehydrogenase n=1 Tax=Thermonema lapsum TaxID=28195 RepID=A0A846MM26_9BACT|nr:dihydrolipoyl dehydrogenase [Thermonema lapsum]NIK72593.1 dihydrolipoamide dehydrogenase [Thermonema lapsum]